MLSPATRGCAARIASARSSVPEACHASRGMQAATINAATGSLTAAAASVCARASICLANFGQLSNPYSSAITNCASVSANRVTATSSAESFANRGCRRPKCSSIPASGGFPDACTCACHARNAFTISFACFLYCSRLGRAGNGLLFIRPSFHLRLGSAQIRLKESSQTRVTKKVGTALSADRMRPSRYPNSNRPRRPTSIAPRYGDAESMSAIAITSHHPDRPQPLLRQLRPSRYRQFRPPQPKPMPAVRIQMHLHRNLGLLQPNVVNQRFLYRVYRVILRLHQKRRRRLSSHLNIWIQLELLFVRPQMPRIKRHRKIRPAAFFVRRIHGRIQPPRKMRADIRYQVPACRKSQHANLVRIDVPLRRVQAHQPYCPLRILQRRGCFWLQLAPALFIPARPRIRHTILQQHARNPLRHQPVAHLRSFQIDGQFLRAAARKHHHCNSRILSARRINRHRRPRHVAHGNPRFARNQRIRYRRRVLLPPSHSLRLRHRRRPDRNLRMPPRRPSATRLPTHSAHRQHNTERKHQSLHHHPPPLTITRRARSPCWQTAKPWSAAARRRFSVSHYSMKRRVPGAPDVASTSGAFGFLQMRGPDDFLVLSSADHRSASAN